VGGPKPRRRLAQHQSGQRGRQRAAVFEQVAQVGALDELGGEVRLLVLGAPVVVDGDDVGMLDLRDELRFFLEAAGQLFVAGKRRAQHLEQDEAVQPLLIAFVDGRGVALGELGKGLDAIYSSLPFSSHSFRR
jgi:hypothetical protein